jgi:hypothetical protein
VGASAQVDVVGVDGELKDIALDVLKMRPNFAYTISEVKQDVQSIFNTGWFKECTPDAVDTRDGVKLSIRVTPNDVVRGMTANGANVLPNAVVESAFRGMYGKNLNFVNFKVRRLRECHSVQGGGSAGLLLGLPLECWVVARGWQNRPALRSVGTEALSGGATRARLSQPPPRGPKHKHVSTAAPPRAPMLLP